MTSPSILPSVAAEIVSTTVNSTLCKVCADHQRVATSEGNEPDPPAPIDETCCCCLGLFPNLEDIAAQVVESLGAQAKEFDVDQFAVEIMLPASVGQTM
jgi:tRNA U54 and U55 pseudouridine synthase Pus10